MDAVAAEAVRIASCAAAVLACLLGVLHGAWETGWGALANVVGAPPDLEQLGLPLTRLKHPSWFDTFLNHPQIKALLPIPVLAAIAPLVWLFFRSTWRRLDAEAAAFRQAVEVEAVLPREKPRSAFSRLSARLGARPAGRGAAAARQRIDQLMLSIRRRRRRAESPPTPASAKVFPALYARPAACFVICAVVLTLQEYYGGRAFYDQLIKPTLTDLEAAGVSWVKLQKYDEYYSYCWWVFARVLGYVLIPFPVWKLLFPSDSLLDMGLRVRGFFSHLWIYGLCLAIVVPVVLVVATQPDFGTYY